MADPNSANSQNILPVQALFNVDGSFNTFVGQGQPFTATISPNQSGLNITSSTINSTSIGASVPSTGAFTGATVANLATAGTLAMSRPMRRSPIIRPRFRLESA